MGKMGTNESEESPPGGKKKNVRDVIFVASDIDTVLHIYIDCACHILPD